MSKEIPLQRDMFSGELVDTRSDYRKRQDKRRAKPRQMALFSAQETVQVGVNPRPWLKDLPAPVIALESQDARTDEERERDWWRAAQAEITPMFEGNAETDDPAPDGDELPTETPGNETKVVDEASDLWHGGWRGTDNPHPATPDP